MTEDDRVHFELNELLHPAQSLRHYARSKCGRVEPPAGR